jgi:hypothetical protein
MSEEVVEAQTLSELKAIWCCNQECGMEHPDHTQAYVDAVHRLRGQEKEEMVEVQEELRKMEQELEELRKSAPVATKPPVTRGSGRKYRLLDTNVGWSSTPQVHAVMAILAAHVAVGEVIDEEKIIEAMVANEVVLDTCQGGKRIWDYYKGSHARGLQAHGNVERL